MATDNFVQPAIPRFDGHYDHWSMLMENFLRSKEYWYVVDSGIAEPAAGVVLTDTQKADLDALKLKDLKAKNYLFQAIDRSTLETILCKDTSKHIWDALKKKYQGNRRAKRVQLQGLRIEFENLHTKTGESVTDYLSRTMTIANKMRIHGEKMEDVTIIKKILRSMTTTEAYLRQLIQSFKRLRVLDPHFTSLEKVPRSICKLKHLTYLDLSGNHALKRLPNSITRLQNLQTLNLNSCYSLEELPRGIRKLVSLRNLYIDNCRRLGYLPCGLGQLSSLHRLTRFILPKKKALAKNYCRLGELKELNNIRGSLCIENLGSVTDAVAESRAANLVGKHSLESLGLIWGDSDINDAIIRNRDEVLLDGLRPHSNLQKLRIEGYEGESFPRWMMNSLVSSLPKLVEVCFNGCGRCKSLPLLGQLPHLKTLEISWMPKLEYIESDHSSTSTISFPSLLKLEIGHCEKLKAVPPTPHLEVLTLRNAHPALINMIYGLNKLKHLNICYMESLECVPEECWKSLASLESLRIWHCHGLTSLSKAAAAPSLLGTQHQSNQVDLDSSDSEELDLPNYDQTSGGNNNNHLILELHSLRFVDLLGLPKLASLPRWLLQASNLKYLSIWGCNNLKALPEQIEALQSLRQLRIFS